MERQLQQRAKEEETGERWLKETAQKEVALQEEELRYTRERGHANTLEA
jgi:hypothetical protein